MLPAEIQRVVLLICLAATGYLLILAWNEDMQESRDQDFYAAEPQIMATEPVAEASFNDDSDTPTLAVSDSDIPAISSLDVAGVEPINVMATMTRDRLVTVTTPSLKIWIDRKGGDVVRVLLPKFPMEIDRPDVPFVLLDQSQQRTYIAQSGLIGADGTDSNGERPLYSADKSNFEISQGEIEVVLRADVAGNPVEKIFRFRADDYLVDVEYRVINNKGSAFVAGMFAQIKRDRGAPSLDESIPLAPQPFYGGATTTPDTRYEKVEFDEQTNVTNEEVLQTTNLETESVVEDATVNEMEKSFTQEAVETQHETNSTDSVEKDASNDLKEFGVDSDSPDLFSSELENSSPEDLLSSDEEEEDDLEIPAFLRRQKN